MRIISWNMRKNKKAWDYFFDSLNPDIALLQETSPLNDDGGKSERSDFASRKRDIYLTFILNCRSDYLVAYPQKEQRIYKTKISRMKLTF